MTQKVLSMAYHRNGICGLGFHVAIVEDDAKRHMLVIRFPKESDEAAGGVLCAAFDLALLRDDEMIKFGGNSWRGDHYSDAMDEAISKADAELVAKYERQRASDMEGQNIG